MALAQNNVEEVRFNLNDLDKNLFLDDREIQLALDKEGNDPSCATGRLLEVLATDKARSAKRASLGNITVEESIDDCLKMAKMWRGRAGESAGSPPPLVGVHTDGTNKDGRSEFPTIGIEDVEEGERKDENIKASSE
jgi:hypothetical protein